LGCHFIISEKKNLGRDTEKLVEQNKIIMQKYNTKEKKQYENADVSF